MTLTFFRQFPEVRALMSEKSDGSMKVFMERSEENRNNREKFFAKQGMVADRIVSAEIVHKTNVEIISSKNSKNDVTNKPRPLFIGNNSNGDDNGDDGGNSNGNHREKVISGADALVTKEKNIFLSVTIADCLVIFFYDPVAQVIGIAHAGWRGLIDDVIDKTFETMLNCGAQTENIFVAFGPSIQKCHFEIQTDILSQFAGYEKHIIKRGGKIFVDLQGIAKEQLQNAGIQEMNIEISALCTFCEEEKFFSYRRDRPEKIQAMAAVIGMKKNEPCGQATVKVCLHEKCCQKGGEQIFTNLKEGLSKEEVIVLPVRECFGYCSEGPNIAINDHIVKGVKPFLAVETVRQELHNPSRKTDGLGSKSIDDLDKILENVTKL